MHSIRVLLVEAQETLQGGDSPRLDAEILLASLLRSSREYLYANPELVVAPHLASDFHLLIRQRSTGIPVAYLTGEKEFWSLPLAVSRETLVPRPETESLVSAALEILPLQGPASILELGTGCGAIALALASERRQAAIIATDLSPEALAVARHNAARHGLDNITFIRSDWFSELAGQRFQLIVTNPPYVNMSDSRMPTDAIRFEPRLALDGGHGGLESIRRITSASGRHVQHGGTLLLEHGFDQGRDVRELFALAGFTEVRTLQDAAGRDRITLGRWP